jgi:sulfopyruvate decarboxylase subunit alpha
MYSPSVPAALLLDALAAQGSTCYTGVPCSLLKNVFALLERGAAGRYVPAVREDSAVGVAAGVHLAGARCPVLMQNSGLGYCLNPLLSLCELYELPLLLVVGWRGAYGDDAPEHVATGARLTDLLGAAAIPHVVLEPAEIAGSVARCAELAEEGGRPAALLVRDAL